MKKLLIRAISCVCVFVLFLSTTSFVVYAEDEKFVALNISGYDSNGKEKNDGNNLFYYKNNTLYAPIQFFEKYTMYDYDSVNQAFVRAGQEFKKATSKVVIDYANSKIDVYYLAYQKETYNIDIYEFSDAYFFPLSEMASYLKSSIVYKNDDTISIISSGISLCDALYNYQPYNSCLDFDDIKDDIFAGNEKLAKTACVLGYVGETIFSFKLTNLMGEYGDYKKYLDIIETAVTNNKPYEQLFNCENLAEGALSFSKDLYKKATKVYKLSANSFSTMFKEYKAVNSLGDDSPLNNFFPEGQAQVDKINSFSKYIKATDFFVDAVDYYYTFYTMNQDNKDSINLFRSNTVKDTRALALNEIAKLYGDSIVTGTSDRMSQEIANYLLEESAGEGAKTFLSGINKVELATKIVNTVFKALGFDLSDNSGYDVMLASQLKSYIIQNVSDDKDNVNTQVNSKNMRLTYILGLLVDIQSYKMGNKLADRYDCERVYDDEMEVANKRLALFYMAKGSEKYDSVEGTLKIILQNKKQISKMNFGALEALDESSAVKMLKSSDDVELMNQQVAELEHDEFYYYFFTDDYVYAIRDDVDSIETKIYTDNFGTTSELSHKACIEKRNSTGNKIIIHDYDGQLFVTDKYIYYVSTRFKDGSDYNDCFDGVDYVRTDLNGENREVLYHDDYVPFGSAIGEPPDFLVTNDALYVSKDDIVKVDLETKKSEVVCDIDINGLTGSDWITLNFVYDDTYYFSLFDNQSKMNGNEQLPDICNGFFRYNKSTGLKHIIEVDEYFTNEEAVRVVNGHTYPFSRYSIFKIKKAGEQTVQYKAFELRDTDEFMYREKDPFSENGIYFSQGDGTQYFYSFMSEKLEKV